MGALSSLLQKEAEKNVLMNYLATVGWSIGRKIYGENYLPTFAELIGKGAQKDERSGQEIVNELKNKLKQRKEAVKD